MESSAFLSLRPITTLSLFIDRSVLFPARRWTLLSLFLAGVIYRLLVYRYLLVTLVLGFYAIYFVLQFFTPAGIQQS